MAGQVRLALGGEGRTDAFVLLNGVPAGARGTRRGSECVEPLKILFLGASALIRAA